MPVVVPVVPVVEDVDVPVPVVPVDVPELELVAVPFVLLDVDVSVLVEEAELVASVLVLEFEVVRESKLIVALGCSFAQLTR